MDVTIEYFIGIHNDPRINAKTVIYGLGSYIPTDLPATLDYIYFDITNRGTDSVTLQDFFLETDGESGAAVIWDMDLPADNVKDSVLHNGDKLIIGFLRDLFTRKLLRNTAVTDPFVFIAGCKLQGGKCVTSKQYSLSLQYPCNPLQDAELSQYNNFFKRRISSFVKESDRLCKQYGSLYDYADLHLTLGMHKEIDVNGVQIWRWREWMPAANRLWLTTDFINFQIDDKFAFTKIDSAGLWELILPVDILPHGTYIELRLESAYTGGGTVKRIPAFAQWVEQDKNIEEQWCARVWDPETIYEFQYDNKPTSYAFPRIYEAHIGIAQPSIGRTEKSVGTFAMFTKLLPRIKSSGYTAVQLMGVLEHLLYKSFGYQVSSYFATSSRFGTPNDFKELVDTAHNLGLLVILDIPHSHSVPNTEQGIARYDTSQYFFAGKHNQWGTISFDFSHEMTRRFLMSNCRYWLQEYRVDGFRFDAVGNMIYVDNGFDDDFASSHSCFYTSDGNPRIDEAGVLYLGLVNTMIHEMGGISIAEEFSGMPGMTSLPQEAGLGFDYRFAMGIPDFWGKFIKKGRTMGELWHEMTNHRSYESTISYVASHDQSINGHDAMIWRLIGDEMYQHMSYLHDSWKASRGVALYKLMRLVTLATADKGYLSFMGDEFGHPEWIDAKGYGHRQWHLTEHDDIKYGGLWAFDKDSLINIVQKYCYDFFSKTYLRHLHNENRTLAFERGKLLFAFNFHETNTQSSLDLWVTPGKYEEILSSDAKKYAGHGNLEITTPLIEHFSSHDSEDDYIGRISIYLPPMVAVIMRRD